MKASGEFQVSLPLIRLVSMHQNIVPASSSSTVFDIAMAKASLAPHDAVGLIWA